MLPASAVDVWLRLREAIISHSAVLVRAIRTKFLFVPVEDNGKEGCPNKGTLSLPYRVH